jgi:monoamine oxidase
MGNLTKVALKFDEAFWDPAVQYFGYLSEIKGKWPYFLNYRAFADANILVALSFGSYPVEVERRPDAEIRAEIMDILRTMFGANAPEPHQSLVTRWSADPYAFGAYSFTGTGVEPEDFDNLAGPVGERLYFAGEHVTFAYHGTVHGAQLSGIAAAKAIGDQVG